jgi:di/tricarboxylate transporter
MREDLVGEPFGMFDFTPVGLSIAAAGVAFLAFGYRLLPAGRKGTASLDAAFNIKGYTTETHVPADSPLVGKTVADLEKLAEGEVEVLTIIRERFRRYTPSPSWTLEAEDTLLLEGESAALERVVAQGKLRLAGGEEQPAEPDRAADDYGVMEAVVTANSPLVDRTPPQVRLAERFQIGLLAVSRSGERLTHRLRNLKFMPGDVIVLQGVLSQMPEALGELRVLPLAGRDIRLGRGLTVLPILVLDRLRLLHRRAAPDPHAFDQPARGL